MPVDGHAGGAPLSGAERGHGNRFDVFNPQVPGCPAQTGCTRLAGELGTSLCCSDGLGIVRSGFAAEGVDYLGCLAVCGRLSCDPSAGIAASLSLSWSLVMLAIAASWLGRLKVERSIATAAVRAVVQLAAVSLVITAVLSQLAWSLVFAAFMFGVAVFTSSRRIEAPQAWPWVAVAIGCGVVPVLTVIFLSGAVPWNGASLVPMAGIIIGGSMSAQSLAGRRCFAALREEHGSYEAALSIGLPRPMAIGEVVERRLPEALVPALDQTRTVGLVTLPGAFVGVLLGGGTPIQAGAAQVLVLAWPAGRGNRHRGRGLSAHEGIPVAPARSPQPPRRVNPGVSGSAEDRRWASVRR